MNQISPMADKQLNKLSRLVSEAEAQIKDATKTKEEAWDRVLEFFAEFGMDGTEGKEMHFVADDGHTFAPYLRRGTPKLDEDKLYKKLMDRYPGGARLWSQITVKKVTVNTVMLEQFIQLGKIDAALVDECLTVPEPGITRLHPEWTKEDRQRAKILGIKEPE